MCTEANYTRFSGTSVERDFVELPSQMLENWMWDKSIIQRVSKHYKTGEQLPDDMLNSLIEVKKAKNNMETSYQVLMGSFDFLVHSSKD